MALIVFCLKNIEMLILKFGAGNEARTRDLDLGKVALYQLSYARIHGILLIFFKLVLVVQFKFGAGNEARTRDLDLGKVALYQLSYARILLLVTITLYLGYKEDY